MEVADGPPPGGRSGAHNLRHHGNGVKTFHHRVVGELTLAYEGLEMAAEPGLTLTLYAAEPGSASAERMMLLSSWAASHRADLDLAEPLGHHDTETPSSVEN